MYSSIYNNDTNLMLFKSWNPTCLHLQSRKSGCFGFCLWIHSNDCESTATYGTKFSFELCQYKIYEINASVLNSTHVAAVSMIPGCARGDSKISNVNPGPNKQSQWLTWLRLHKNFRTDSHIKICRHHTVFSSKGVMCEILSSRELHPWSLIEVTF